MSIRIHAGFVGGKDFSGWVRAVRDAGAVAVQAGVSTAATELRDEMRNQVSEAGMGERLGNAIGVNLYPRAQKGSFTAAGFVFPRGRKANAIFDAFNSASVITAHQGRYLAIPTENAGRGNRYAKATPEEFQHRTGIKLHLVKLKNGHLVLMGEAIAGKRGGVRAATKGRLAQGRNRQSLVFFVLIPAAHMPRRLSFDAAAQKWADRIPDLIEAATQGGEE
jgi:hypothetical protein